MVGGKLKTDFRYNAGLCYNTFPFPSLSEHQKLELERAAFHILEIRERYPEKTAAELYDKVSMPKDLRDAHLENDQIIERCYGAKQFKSDTERMDFLLHLYKSMTSAAVIQEEMYA
jgi:hypothetical protein